MRKRSSLRDIHVVHIDGTKHKEHIRLMDVYLCCISHPVKRAIAVGLMRVYITTKTLKHIYDRYWHEKNQPDIYETIVDCMREIIENPDVVKKNKQGKKAEVVFLKEISGHIYACPVEKVKIKKRKKVAEVLYVETAFVLKKGGFYLKNNQILYEK